jgi:hypothetical protein
MANTLRIKRSTSTTAPATLQNAEIAFSELSDKLFIGVGTGGAGGSATSIVAIGGKGAFTDLSSDQTVAGTKTFSSSPVVPTVTSTDSSTKAASTGFVKAQGYLTAGDLSTYAPLASPSLTGTPIAPTATLGTNTTQIATTQFVGNAVAALVATAPAALDTLNELALALGNDANFATTISTSLGEKLVKTNNLSDLSSASTARTNLGLGSMATQSAASVAITGGTIDNITVDCGTF